MIVWFWTNVSLTLLSLLFASVNGKAPHRFRFIVCFAALCGWMIPWGQMARLVPATPVIPGILPVGIELDFDQAPFLPGSDSVAAGWLGAIAGNADAVLLVFTVIGASLFVHSSLRYLLFVRRMSVGSVSGSYLWARMPSETPGSVSRSLPELRIQRRIPGAVTTGILVPKVWVHQDLVEHPELSAALVHEYRHVRNFDNAYLWGITLVERLFWWNPLVRFLSSRTRRLQELSCDEACARDLSNYREMLKALILSLSVAVGRPCPQTPSINHSRNFNVERLRALERRYAMKMRHYLSTVILLIGSFAALSWAAAQNSPEQPRIAPTPPVSTDQALRQFAETTGEELQIPGFETGTSIEEAEELYRSLRLYSVLLERQYDRLNAEVESLRSELQAMKDEIAEAN